MTIRRLQATHVHPLQAALGEGPVWDSRTQRLWCVDILAPAVHCLDPITGHCSRWNAPAKIGWVAPVGAGVMMAGLADGLYRFTPDEDAFDRIVQVEPDLPGNRINDGTVGPDGAFWFGTMDDAESSPSGRVYRFDGDRLRDCGIGPMCITNGPAVSPDGRRLYIVDTLARQVWAYPVDTDATLGPGTCFVTLDSDEGHPDGVTCDAEGGVWLGLWGGWQARRYDAAGELTDVVEFPVANVTKIALGGPGGRTAFATTARKGLDRRALDEQPFAGDIFSFAVQVPGVRT